MFRITEYPSSGSLVQCLSKNYKNDSIVSVDMDKVAILTRCACVYTHAQRVRIRCHNTDLVHVNGNDRIILVILAKHCTRLPDDGSSAIRNMLKHF